MNARLKNLPWPPRGVWKMKSNKDWMMFMYQDSVYYPFLLLQILFIWYFIGGLVDHTLNDVETIICIVGFDLLILFYAVSGRCILRMLDEAAEKTGNK